MDGRRLRSPPAISSHRHSNLEYPLHKSCIGHEMIALFSLAQICKDQISRFKELDYIQKRKRKKLKRDESKARPYTERRLGDIVLGMWRHEQGGRT